MVTRRVSFEVALAWFSSANGNPTRKRGTNQHQFFLAYASGFQIAHNQKAPARESVLGGNSLVLRQDLELGLADSALAAVEQPITVASGKTADVANPYL